MSAITPMLATIAQEIPDDPAYIVEPKYDGWRATARVDDLGGEQKAVTMFTRTGASIANTPYIEEALACLPDDTMLDGEIVDLAGGKQWNRTQSILSRKKIHVPTQDDPMLTYVLFDVLELEGENLMGETLDARRKLLKLIGKLVGGSCVQVVEQIGAEYGSASMFYERLIDEGFEGVVCKRLDSVYAPGARNGNWLKIKPEAEMDVEVTGTYAPAPGSKYDGNSVGGITFTATHEDGTTYDGRCAGMDDELREALHTEPANYVGKVAEVAYASIGDAGALRFPRFQRFRDKADKSVADLTATIPSNSNARVLLKRALEAEERADRLEEENKELRLRLGAADKAIGKPKRSGSRSAGKTRNYNAMKDDKLEEALKSLGEGHGDAHARAVATEQNGGWTVRKHLAEAMVVAEGRGLR